MSYAIVMSDGNIAFTIGTNDNVSVYNNGAIIGRFGISTSGSFSTIVNSSSGTIGGFTYAIAINVDSEGTYVQNSGSIVSNDIAILAAGTDVGIDNSGLISGYRGISLSGADAVIHNSGTITGQIQGVIVNSTTAGGTIVNTGHLDGGTYAILSVGSLAVHNAGSISGDIQFTAGANSIDGVGGSINGVIMGGTGVDVFNLRDMTVSGTIAGGLGSDTITGTAQGDLIYGDNVSGDTTGGADTLSGGYGDDTIYGGFGADTIMGNQGDDTLYGNQDNDWMHGGQGDDILYGGQGNDTLNGGLGNDVLYGNLGNDIFVVAANFGHDIIGDFGVVAGNSDVVSFSPGTFGSYADVAAHMVQSGANVVLTLDAGDGLTFANTTIAALTADHFVFG